MPSVTTLLLCAVALFSAGKASAATPELVNLPKLKPLGAQAQEPAASSRVAVLELSTSQSIDPNMARRVAVELTAALKAHGRYPNIVKVGEVMSQLPLEVQERLNDCSAPSCLLELGALLSVSAVITPRLTLEARGYRLDLDYMDVGVQARWRRELSQRATEAELVTGLPELVRSLWKKATVPAGASVSKSEDQPMSEDELMRWGSVLVSVGGLAVFGSSYMVLGAAQEEYEPATATAKDYDQLASAQTQARVMWGAGLALTGAGIAGFSLIGR